ncbi:putative transposase [Mycobacterium xenopi 4042]|uniref:Putative transposase n=1 Tax=Mycobacterium xenopi 4042 TaxID=1299334 RepID=X7YTL5_MYCXE|nr:putative transposase [Mycobacterium xenopi 4042]
MWRYHPFVTNSALPVDQADITHRRHAIIETTFADLIDGPLAHIRRAVRANCAWLACAVIAHNLLRAVGTLAGGHHAVARGATLRRDLINIPARFAPRPQTNAAPTRPLALASQMEGPVAQRHRLPDRATPRRLTPPSKPCPPAIPGPTQGTQRKAGTGQRITHAHRAHSAASQNNRVDGNTKSPIHGFRLRHCGAP